jgi:hypothetical protein
MYRYLYFDNLTVSLTANRDQYCATKKRWTTNTKETEIKRIPYGEGEESLRRRKEILWKR